MNKRILSFAIGLFCTSGIIAQNVQNTTLVGEAKVVDRKDVQYYTAPQPQINVNKHRGPGDPLPSLVGSKYVIGETTYDLQTNGALQQRIVEIGNEIHCGWTMSLEANPTPTSAYSDRGTGYNAYVAGSWGNPPTARLEGTTRTGFGSMDVDGNGDVVYVAHDGTNIVLNRKSGTNWTTSTLPLSTIPSAIWPDVACAGNWMYIITGSTDTAIKSNGIRNGYFFSRSSDNGATWVDNMIPMPLIDSSGHYRGGGNAYSISAQGNNVAIVFGDLATDLTLLYSSDNGATWTKSVIWDWPLENFDFASTLPTDTNGDSVPDTLWCNDGSYSMVLDANGDAHVAFPLVRVYKDGSSTGYRFFYSTYLAYYNTIGDSVLLTDYIFRTYRDCDKDGFFGLGSAYVDANGYDAIYNHIGTITAPSISITGSNPPQVFMTYTALVDNDSTDAIITKPYWEGSSGLVGQPYRDVFVQASPDGGGSWTYPINISGTSHYEEMFPSAPRRISGTDLNVIYQGDIEPGTIMQNDDLFDPFFGNWIIYQQVALADILAADSNSNCDQMELPFAAEDITFNNGPAVKISPNPSSDIFNVEYSFNDAVTEMKIDVVDITGRSIETRTLLNPGLSGTVHFNLGNYAKGNYMIRFETEQGVRTEKITRN